ncbi:dynamin family protein [Piscibacillus halophilus]|uniref:Small GTP-binding protein domain-containing protein n=1 Tax=Piscibacillus halophilus TaxID=571933 RepID=A0A1H8ZKT0_9BACI|nr:dynamin family protein [Piscibacillus halophilus]SEP64965.1 small GTP-binding protein domain-containing protein [Piscibacillus halophilus]
MITTESVSTSFHFDLIWNELKSEPYQNLDKKLLKLYDKWQEQRMTIGFTGHFSAGKSTLINALLEENILPSSPIPTSANIVEVQYGEDEIIYHLPNEQYAKENEINSNHVNQLARNGDTVQSLSIKKPLPLLENQVTLMDTPGIDSSDDEEFKRTLSNTYLIDFFVYVMDYNHVQSEVNFKFLKELEENGVPYIMVVNQVDKHNESELLFDSFKQSLKESCQSWGIHPKSIYYTSLLQTNHPLNQFLELQAFLKGLIDEKDELIKEKLTFELSRIIDEWTYHKLQLDQYNFDMVAEKRDSIKRLIEERNTILNETEQLRMNLNQDLNEIFQNAYIMTFETRELAKGYLESIQPKFKVGKLFAKKKTKEEREKRLEIFLNDIQERVKTEMVWHVRRLLINRLNDYQIEDSALTQTIQDFNVNVTEGDLKKSVNPSAEVNSNSVLIYTNQLHKDLSQLVKQKAAPIMSELEELVTDNLQEKVNGINEKVHLIEGELEQFNELENLEHQQIQLSNEIKDQTFTHSYSSNEHIEQAYQEFLNVEYIDINELVQFTERIDVEGEIQSQNITNPTTLDIHAIQEKSHQLLNNMSDLEPLKPFYDSINHQLNQLENANLTIALFGAFSAGKSSFANAWLGESVLPASPNPTTAAINKIAPVSEEHPHGDVQVRFKTTDQMLKQLFLMIEPYTSQTFNDLSDLVKFLNKNQSQFNQQLNKTEASFLNAFLKGYKHSRENLGKTFTIDLDEFSSYVTVESISCFVEEMTVYYDCELTRKGITLVDTPGADSIHARHTNTSFHYVKHSDAIIYVNYYNHAFSRADREFLLQLGRVKETFALDKMFFILNAADLAKNDEELLLVTNYLNDQLKQYGIQQPSIYAISSKALLEGDEAINDQPFFKRFDEFIEHEAKELIANQLELEFKRLKQFLASTIQEASYGTEEQEQNLHELTKEVNEISHWVSKQEDTQWTNELVQEIDELTHYLRQRLMIQMNDLMKESINPATINANGKKGKEQLKVALKKLQSYITEQWSKEISTTNIILDRQLSVTIDHWAKNVNQYINQHTQLSKLYKYNGSYSDLETFNIESLLSESQIENLLSLYKNKKEFFEQQKVNELFEEVKKYTQDSVKQSVDLLNKFLCEHYDQEFKNVKEQLIHNYQKDQLELIKNKRLIYQNSDYLTRFNKLLDEI